MVHEPHPTQLSPNRPSRFKEEEMPIDSAKATSPSSKSDRKGKSFVHDKIWLCIFLIHTLAYLGASAYNNYVAVTSNKQAVNEDTSLGPIDIDELIMLSGAVIIGLGAAFVAFAIVVFAPRWFFLTVVGALLTASGAPLGLTMWKTFSVGAQMYHTGMLVLGTITLGGVTFWALRAEGVSVTVMIFRTFKDLLGKRQQIYWLIIAWTILQSALQLWCTLSVAAVIIRFQPESQGSICGWGIVSGIVCGLVIAQYWLAATLSEILNAVVVASAFDIPTLASESSEGARQSTRTSLKNAGYRSLGSLAKNALFADLIDALVWPLSALDRVSWVNDVLAMILGWYLRWLCRAMERYNRFIGVTIALQDFKIPHSTAEKTTQNLVKYGNTRDKDIGAPPIGHPMGPIIKKLRTEGGGASGLNGNCETGSGAFMGSHNSKSLLVAGAIACGVIAGGVIYSAMIFDVEELEVHLDPWDWAIVEWSFLSAFLIAYHLLMVMEASVCRVYAVLRPLDDSSGQMAPENSALSEVLETWRNNVDRWDTLVREDEERKRHEAKGNH